MKIKVVELYKPEERLRAFEVVIKGVREEDAHELASVCTRASLASC